MIIRKAHPAVAGSALSIRYHTILRTSKERREGKRKQVLYRELKPLDKKRVRKRKGDKRKIIQGKIIPLNKVASRKT